MSQGEGVTTDHKLIMNPIGYGLFQYRVCLEDLRPIILYMVVNPILYGLFLTNRRHGVGHICPPKGKMHRPLKYVLKNNDCIFISCT